DGDLADAQAAIDFTTPEAGPENVRAALEQDVRCIVGTTGFDLAPLGELARERGLQLFHASNFAIGALLMIRSAPEAAAYMPSADIGALHRAGWGAPAGPDAPGPPMGAADEAPPEDATFFLEMDSGEADSSSGDSATAVGINEYCAVIWSDAAGGDRQDCGPPTPEQEAQ